MLSVDDWSYYHSYDQKGYADKAVLDENGDVKCEYTDTNGNVTVGDYDVVPRLNTFLKAHPDASYKGARGMATERRSQQKTFVISAERSSPSLMTLNFPVSMSSFTVMMINGEVYGRLSLDKLKPILESFQ